MPVIQVTSNVPGAGKTCVIGALLVEMAEAGKKVGYYKPFAASPEQDLDSSFISQHLFPDAISSPVPAPNPLPQITVAGRSLAGGVGQLITDALNSLATTVDMVLVESPDLLSSQGQYSPLPQEVASLLGSKVLLVYRYEKGLQAESMAQAAGVFGDQLSGVIINGFPVHRRREIGEELVGALQNRGIPVFGAIPEDRVMLAVTVQQIADYLGGRWVQEPVSAGDWVDRFLIGGNIMDSGPNYFGRYSHQAVITRAERPDIQMASLMSETRCLVLTGGSEPIEYIKVEASKREVPIILVSGNTLDTAETLGGLIECANPYSPHKVKRFAQLMQEHLDMTGLRSALA